jgi:hypothetical protein
LAAVRDRHHFGIFSGAHFGIDRYAFYAVLNVGARENHLPTTRVFQSEEMPAN